jgi:hypothetical protein
MGMGELALAEQGLRTDSDLCDHRAKVLRRIKRSKYAHGDSIEVDATSFFLGA